MTIKKIGLAFNFSHNSRALIKEADRIANLFDAEYFILHCGSDEGHAKIKIEELLEEQNIEPEKVNIIIERGDPVNMILNSARSSELDLLISGALEKERTLNYYLGSVARKLIRNSQCSMLILPSPKIEPKPFKNFCVSVDYTTQSEHTLLTAYQLAKKENAERIHLVREYQLPGLSIAVSDSGSMSEIDSKVNLWREEEKEKLNLLIKELNLTDIEIKPVCLNGKEGWAISNYVKEVNADILAVTAPRKKLKFFDRVFSHDLEFILRELPSPLLIVKS